MNLLLRSRLIVSLLSIGMFHAALPRAVAGEEQEEGFKPLFNGKDFTGWVNVNGSPGTWSVRDGMVICTGKPICVLRTERMYENFIVDFEWRHMTKGGNAGFFVWSDAITAKGQPFTRSIECQVLDGQETPDYTSHGDVFSIHGSVMTPDRPHPNGWERCLPSERRSKPSPEWNHYRITCKDGTLKLAVNGKEVSGGREINPRKGYLCLESEGSEVHFRNIKLKELEPAKKALAPEQVCLSDEGFKSLYTGVDLSGWKLNQGDEAHWKASDWHIDFDGKGETFWTEKEFGDFTLIVDCRAMTQPKEGDPSSTGELMLFLRGKDGCGIQLPAAKNTDWRRAVLTVKGDRVRVQIDGEVLAENQVCRSLRGPVGLGARMGGAVQFANVYLKELAGE